MVFYFCADRIRTRSWCNNNDDVAQPLSKQFISVLGCESMTAPEHSRIELQEENRLVVRCQHSKEFFHFVCVDHTWVGRPGNCSTAVSTTVNVRNERVASDEFNIFPLAYLYFNISIHVLIPWKIKLKNFAFEIFPSLVPFFQA
ncbi:hypothetical protein HELRODRAFT_175108 [Helobdella robusta]|uniref:Uncharacterized protein n=1 Tax=Helobdella robusta TaxID=6412 RepID=T1F8V3_HELRO|nr:hypothetical protein HELRODRAFT_175108 [Helobdella robusta]ESO01081.1 hypothetical protein HELRODRAFT_175108 [Helobdella robusta]